MMNHKADIAKDPFLTCIYFLSLLDGPRVEGWVDIAYKWLKGVKNNQALFPIVQTLGWCSRKSSWMPFPIMPNAKEPNVKVQGLKGATCTSYSRGVAQVQWVAPL